MTMAEGEENNAMPGRPLWGFWRERSVEVKWITNALHAGCERWDGE